MRSCLASFSATSSSALALFLPALAVFVALAVSVTTSSTIASGSIVFFAIFSAFGLVSTDLSSDFFAWAIFYSFVVIVTS